MHKITRLDNDLTVITDRMPNTGSVAIGFWIKAGGRYEYANLQGISHFLEHILFKGTKKRDYKQIKESIEGVGGAFNAFTSEECTCYYVKIVSKYLEIAVDVLSDMVLNPLFAKKEIDKERNVIIEELRMYLDLPNQYVSELLDELLWPEHPLGRSLLGTHNTLAAIKRKELMHYKGIYHVPSNITIVACGDVEHDMIVALLQKAFSSSAAASSGGLELKRPHKTQAAPKINFYSKATEQTHLCLGVHGLDRLDQGRYAQSILNVILGGNMSSRLFNEVREKRCLAYEIGSGIKEYVDTGALFIHAGVDNNKAAEAVAVIVSELNKLKDKRVSKQELTQAKEYYKGRLFMGLEDALFNMLFLGDQITSTGKVYTKDGIEAGVDKVGLNEIKAIAEKIFVNNSLNMAIIGPHKRENKKEIEKAFKF